MDALFQEGGHRFDDCSRAEHTNLDSGWRQVGAEVLEGARKQVRCDRLDRGDAQRGLHSQGGDCGGAEEAVGSEGLEIGGDACAAGGIVAGDRENGLRLASGGVRGGGQIRATE